MSLKRGSLSYITISIPLVFVGPDSNVQDMDSKAEHSADPVSCHRTSSVSDIESENESSDFDAQRSSELLHPELDKLS